MRLFLIRHGQTPSNVLGLLDTGAPGPGLTELGGLQAAGIPAALEKYELDGIYVSRLTRTHLTAAPLADARGLAPEQLPGLHEISAGDLELRGDHPAVRTYIETAFAWGAGDLSARMPGAEDGHEFFGRFDADIAAVEAAGHRTPVLFSHGAAIRVWVAARIGNLPKHASGAWELHNTGVVELEGSTSSGWRLISWQGKAIGGEQLDDAHAADPTGETLEEARSEPQSGRT